MRLGLSIVVRVSTGVLGTCPLGKFLKLDALRLLKCKHHISCHFAATNFQVYTLDTLRYILITDLTDAPAQPIVKSVLQVQKVGLIVWGNTHLCMLSYTYACMYLYN